MSFESDLVPCSIMSDLAITENPATISGDTSTSSGFKRPGAEDEPSVCEPPSKRARPPPHSRHIQGPLGASYPPKFGFLDTLSAMLSGPYPIAGTQYVIFDTAHIETFLAYVYEAFLSRLYPDARSEPVDLITCADFVLVSRYLFKARIDHCYSNVVGLRPPNRCHIPTAYEVPKCLADIINGIGKFSCQQGLSYCPQSEPESTGADSQPLRTRVTHTMMGSYAKLIHDLKVRDYIQTGFISCEIQGTAWWLLSARKFSNATAISVDQESVRIVGVFPESTPDDVIMAAITQRQYAGLTECLNRTKTIFSVCSVRTSFIFKA